MQKAATLAQHTNGELMAINLAACHCIVGANARTILCVGVDPHEHASPRQLQLHTNRRRLMGGVGAKLVILAYLVCHKVSPFLSVVCLALTVCLGVPQRIPPPCRRRVCPA